MEDPHLRRQVVRHTDTIYLQLSEGEWARSEFPHELIILDFDERDQLLGIEVLGEAAASLERGLVEREG